MAVPKPELAAAPPPGPRARGIEVRPIPTPEAIAPGEPTPDSGPMVLLGLARDGEQVLLSEYQGKILLVSYWASWCPPCWAEMPQLEAIYQQYAGRGLEVIAVNRGEEQGAIDTFLRNQSVPLTFPVVSDRAGAASESVGVRGVPSAILYDREGAVAGRYTGVFGFDPGRVRGDIERLLESGG